jgi:hypothetical protein
MIRLRTRVASATLLALVAVSPAAAQLGRQQGLVEPNVAADQAQT